MSRHIPVLVSVSVLLLLVAGCAKKGPVTGQGGVSVIDQAEIEATDARHVLELIQRVRPAWLLMGTRRNPSDPFEEGGPIVLVNSYPPPPRPLFSLQYMSLENIREIRYLTRTRTETWYRVRAPAGAILILTTTQVIPEDTVPQDTGRANPRISSSNRGEPSLPTGASEANHD